jgi:hypothetical protein
MRFVEEYITLYVALAWVGDTPTPMKISDYRQLMVDYCIVEGVFTSV